MKEVRSKKMVDEDTIAHKSVFNLICQLMIKLPEKSSVPADFSGEIDPLSPIGYFPGCIDFLDSFLEVGTNFHPIGDATIKLMNNVGVKPRVMGLKCCGHDELWQGDQETFEKLKHHNTQAIKESGIKTLLTSCAECFRTFAIDYNLDIKVLHLCQFLKQPNKKLTLKGKGIVTYHDPCRLGRHMQIYDPPRNLISQVKGIKLVELENTREDCQCCGVSAWLSCTSESKALLVNKLSDAERTGATTLLTTCTKCLAHLSCVLNEKPPLRDFQIEVQDLTVFLADKLS